MFALSFSFGDQKMKKHFISRQKLKMETRISKVDAGFQRRLQNCKV